MLEYFRVWSRKYKNKNTYSYWFKQQSAGSQYSNIIFYKGCSNIERLL